jgi:tight adherence protein B
MYIWILLFLTCFLLIGAPAYWMAQTSERRTGFKRMLANNGPSASMIASAAIFTGGPERAKPLTAWMARWAWFSRWTRPAGTNLNLGVVLAASGALAIAGLFAGNLLSGIIGPYALPLVAALSSLIPFLYIRRKSKRFIAAFEEQLPDAVDFLARSLRSGTALSLSMEMVAAETPEPLRSQFLLVTRELALGAPLEPTLKKLVGRVPLLELRFFVAAVVLQRETGGNLGEILDKLGIAIRERLQLKAKVKAASSQGRLTARILSLLPVAVMMMIYLLSPAYLRAMTGDPAGRTMLMAAVVAELTAFLIMNKITNIEI